jgi:hypothetical protein
MSDLIPPPAAAPLLAIVGSVEDPVPPRKVRLGEFLLVTPSLLGWPPFLARETGPLVALATSVTPDGFPRTLALFPTAVPPTGLNGLIMPYDPSGEKPGSWRFLPEPD